MKKMKIMRFTYLKAMCIILTCWLAPFKVFAQYARSTYFMENTPFRQQLNPALTPSRGYINIPVIGSVNASVSSNALGMKDVGDVIKNSSDADYFLSDKFVDRLKSNNKINVNLSTDIVSLGWYKGLGFWTANLSMKVDAGTDISQNIFHFLRDTRGMNVLGWTNYAMNAGEHKVNINSYIEAGVGYAYPFFGDRLTLGGRVKLLFGIANIKINIRDLSVNTRLTGIDLRQDWSKITLSQLRNIRGEASITSDAEIEASMKGFELRDGDNGLVKDIKRAGSLGIAGMGAGIDLGAAYKVNSHITLSASLLDLGFISWGKSHSYKAGSNVTKRYTFDAAHLDEVEEFGRLMASGEILNMDMLQIKQNEGRSRTTSLYTTMVLGGEYQLLNNRLSFGLLSTTRFTRPDTTSELTLSSGYKVNRMLGFSLSYSMIQSGGSGLGVGMTLGPVTLATDYVCFSNNTRCVNALMGISIPL